MKFIFQFSLSFFLSILILLIFTYFFNHPHPHFFSLQFCGCGCQFLCGWPADANTRYITNAYIHTNTYTHHISVHTNTYTRIHTHITLVFTRIHHISISTDISIQTDGIVLPFAWDHWMQMMMIVFSVCEGCCCRSKKYRKNYCTHTQMFHLT